MTSKKGTIVKVSGPLIVAENMKDSDLFDVVKVGKLGLTGEIIEMHQDMASIQVYEETSGLGPGEEVISSNHPLSMELGPGLIGGIYDGIGRPLTSLREKTGDRLQRGINVPTLDRDKKWHFTPTVKKDDHLTPGAIIGTVKETDAVNHYIMLPPNISGRVISIEEGDFKVADEIGKLELDNKTVFSLTLMQKYPVRKQRPIKEKLPPNVPLVTGQRVIDTLFPITKGGVAAVPGPFGSGKTIVQHQLAKWADADIIVYIGCGERGNEMTDVLNEFPKIHDPKTGKTLMERTVLIANTSDMPVAAREASVYTGITIAEYFRDMGYSVALMADSTSRWAEALREMSGRLQEMPGEEGYPAYLGSRLAGFYERAGRVITLNGKEAALSVIGAVSPPGGDISEPVSQATLRIVKVFWNLDSSLAYKRHFPAVNWLKSYSLYWDRIKDWYEKNGLEGWGELRSKINKLLQEEAKLEEIVKLVGIDAIGPVDRMKLEAARSIREDFLHQNAFNDVDTYTPLKKQLYMMKLILEYYDQTAEAAAEDVSASALSTLPVREQIGRFKYLPYDQVEKNYYETVEQIRIQIGKLKDGSGL
ncbi:MAG: V-type ATP synthase subunit A [Oscillospiraceae bacterium]|nr:V-type ATP synthase subunit A [Oscillospiraceae bacterium]